ncbi:MAG TPA: hypothetical protein VJ813_03580 [Vicinamibacterales bacterium]|nr:hypothetical protein [Vicinamibacterales bacterium]
MAGILIGGLYLSHAWIFGDYVADDAGISLAYARNLIAGFGPVLYPGGEAVEGYSNPLWTALLALGAAVRLDGADGVPLLKGLGLALGAATILLTAAASRIAYPADTRVPWLAPALLASLTPFVFWTASGMENALYACLMLLAVLLQLRELQDPMRRQWSVLALAGVALTRPEGVAFFAAFLTHRIVSGARGRRLAGWIGMFVGIYSAFLAVRVIVFGDWLPNTYYAKVALMDRHLSELPRYLATPDDAGRIYLVEFAKNAWPVLLVAAAGLADRRAWRTNLLMTGIVAGTALYVVYVGGDFWPAGRFFTAVLPLGALAAQHAVNVFGPRRAAAASACAAVLVGIVLNRSLGLSGDLRVRHDGDTLISLQGRLAHGRRVLAMTSALGIQDPLVLDPDIGGPTLAGLRVLDLGGLTDIHIARFRYYPAFLRSYVFEERRPHIIRTHSSWTRTSRVTAFPEFHEQYEAIRSRRDARGLHGEFIRRDLLVRHRPTAGGAVPRAASFRQAVADRRARRAREAERERANWIELYVEQRMHDKLRRAFREHEAAATLPSDPSRLGTLYRGLMAAGDAAGAERVRRGTAGH